MRPLISIVISIAREETEFLYECVRHTVEHDLPREIDYLQRHDEAIRRIMDTVEMPDRLAENLVMFIRQNKGKLSQKRREGEFQELRDEEVIFDRSYRQRCLRWVLITEPRTVGRC
jgi:hypothetical protein